MAKDTYKNPSIVSGLSIQDILDMDISTFNKLNLKDLRTVTGRLVSAGNKRIRAFEAAGERSPAIGRLAKPNVELWEATYTDETWPRDSNGKKLKPPAVPFSTTGKNLSELRHEFTRVRNFLRDKTSTLRGWRKVRSATLENLRLKEGIELSPEMFEKFWEAYEKAKELDPAISWKKFKYEALREISDYMTDHEDATAEDIAIILNDRINELYEKNEEMEAQNAGVSDFFKPE